MIYILKRELIPVTRLNLCCIFWRTIGRILLVSQFFEFGKIFISIILLYRTDKVKIYTPPPKKKKHLNSGKDILLPYFNLADFYIIMSTPPGHDCHFNYPISNTIALKTVRSSSFASQLTAPSLFDF